MVTINLRIFTLLAAIFSANYSFAGTVDTAQRMLNQLGYNAGTVDGAYGGKTRGALEQFYADIGGSFDGKLDANEVTDLQSAMAQRGIEVYVPLNSYDVQRQWTVNPTKADALVPSPRHSRNVGQGIFYFGPRTKFADFNGDGIDDITTVGVSAKALTNSDYKLNVGRCAKRDPEMWGLPADCAGEDFKMKPRIAWGKADGTYEWSSDDMFIHPPANGNKIPGFSFANGLLVADYNGDNIPDLFINDSSFGWDGTYQSLYLSNGDNTWTYSTFSHVKGAQRDFGHGGTTGDIDGDGDIDILTTKKGGGLACYYNDGTGYFRYKSNCYPGGQIVYSVALADIDGDGDLDAYVGSNSYNGIGGLGKYKSGYRILENNGHGSFKDKVRLPQQDCWVTNPVTETVDIDGDGDMDFVASFTQENYLFAGVQVVRNEGNWNFSQETVQATDWEDYSPLQREMYRVGYKNDECGMYVNNKRTGKVEKYAQETHIMATWFEQITFVDVDSDGDKDIVGHMPTSMEGYNKDIDEIHGAWFENRGEKFYHRSYKHFLNKNVKRLRY